MNTTPNLSNSRNTSYILDVSLALLIFTFLIAARPAFALNVEFLNCNDDAVSFDADFLPWGIQDLEGNGVVWSNCAAEDNTTGESGRSLCVVPGGVNYDTTVTTNDFNLKGATSASLKFVINYQDAQLFKDRIDVEVRVGAGPWNLHGTEEINDWGLPAGPGIEVIVPLNPYLGADDVQVRFRYYDQSNTGVGDSIQIDNIRLACVGGADLSLETTPSATTVIEGDTIDMDYLLLNNGPKDATDLIQVSYFSAAATILGVTGVPLGSMEEVKVNQFAMGLGAPLSNGASLNSVSANVRMAMYPETALEVTSPDGIAGLYDSVGSLFGPEIPSGAPQAGVIVLALDGMGGSDHDGCEPLTNADDVNGRIVLLHDVLCEPDIAVKNAQDAGAVAVLVGKDDNSPINSLLYPSATLPPLRPSGLVIAPITIPSVRISLATSSIFKLNLASSIEVQIQAVEVLAQEQGTFSLTKAEEFDPDFTVGDFLAGDFDGGSSNMDTHTITVLRDTDKDGVSDIDDECDSDPSKTVAGLCGCGVVDEDSNSNGTVDCLESPADDSLQELRASTSMLIDALNQLKPLRDGMKKAARKKALTRKKLVKQLLGTLLADIQTHGASVASSINQPGELMRRRTKKALRLKSKQFRKNKKRALKEASSFQAILS